MQRALVVVDPVPEMERLLELAAEYADCADAELVLFHVTDEQAGEQTRRKMAAFVGGDHRYEPSVDDNQRFAADVGTAFLDDVPFEASGAVGDPPGRILAAAADSDSDHVFMTGRKRSPTGKAVFGDTTQAVLLGASCPVTLVMR